MKRRLAIALFLLSFVFFILNILPQKGVVYSEVCVSESQIQELIDARVVAEESLYTKILFNEQELMLDAAGNRLFYSLVENSRNSYNPYIEWESEEKNVEIAIAGEEITLDVIAKGEEFQLVLYTEKEYQIVNVAFTTLPLLSLNYEGDMDDQSVRQLELTLFDNRQYASNRVIRANGEIRIRGRYTRNFPKLGYKITLYEDSTGGHRREKKQALLGMRQDGDWILYAAYNDEEKVRNLYCSNLWKESCATNNMFGIDNGMEYRYIELFLNGNYWGLYALGYPIDAKQLQMNQIGEYMYKKSDPYVSEIDIDFNAEGAVQGYEIKELGVNKAESWEPLKRYYKFLLQDQIQYSQLGEFVDINNCIDIFLFINMIQGIDHANLRGENIIHNMYMTNKSSSQGDAEIMLYTPWDMDRTWGYGFGNYDSYLVSPDQNVIMQTNPVYLLLQQNDENIKRLLVQRYSELRRTAWSDEHLMQLTYLYESQIFDSGAFSRDKQKWPDGIYIDEQHRLNLFRRHILDRMNYLDAYVNQFSEH